MSDYPTFSNNHRVMSIPSLIVTESTPPATPEYHHQPYSPCTTVASGTSFQLPSIVVQDDPLADTLISWRSPVDQTADGSSNNYQQPFMLQQQHHHQQEEPSDPIVEERRRRNKIASAKYRAKRNQENERLRKWIDDLRQQNAILIRALNDVYSQEKSTGNVEKDPSHRPTATNGYAPHL
ncbi:hypothetical protein BX666DRAFT_1956551 [Dichotomocladium elegans]|nr:hypothetical protein BX666DRAFT_1956551 [Dichotomocladium elegans]